MALSLVGGAFAFTGCTDYEDDINALDDRVSALESTVADLQSQIEAGAVITSVTQSDNGITVTLSNGQSYEITNGKDGANGADGADGRRPHVLRSGVACRQRESARNGACGSRIHVLCGADAGHRQFQSGGVKCLTLG